MKNSVKNGLAVGAAAAATGLIGHHRLTQKMMRLAMDREKPKDRSHRKISVSGSHKASSTTEAMQAAALRLENSSDSIPVETVAHDGVPLVGHWYPCEKTPERIIIAMHGWRSSWSWDFGIIADFWHENNCSVLFAEQRGQSSSGGEHMSFGLLERHDCAAWANWVADNISDELPVYLAGVSMGATTVLMASELELPENVRGIAADSGFTSPNAIWKHVSEKNLHIPYALYQADAHRLCQQRIHMRADAASTTEALTHCKVPVLFIHGTADHFVPVEMTYENYEACASKKRLLIVPSAEHCMSYLVEKENYERTVTQFWNECEHMPDG